jgi:hypothetical protein
LRAPVGCGIIQHIKALPPVGKGSVLRMMSEDAITCRPG